MSIGIHPNYPCIDEERFLAGKICTQVSSAIVIASMQTDRYHQASTGPDWILRNPPYYDVNVDPTDEEEHLCDRAPWNRMSHVNPGTRGIYRGV